MTDEKQPRQKPHFPLKMLRSALGVSQRELAELVGLGPQTITMIEAGTRKLTLDAAEKVMLATGVNPQSLLVGRYPTELWSGNEYTDESWDLWMEQTLYSREHVVERLEALYAKMELELSDLLGNPRARLLNYFGRKSIEWLADADSFGLRSDKLSQSKFRSQPPEVLSTYRRNREKLKDWFGGWDSASQRRESNEG